MVNNYKRKTNRGSWSEHDMELALQAARNTTLAEASRRYRIPLGTLHIHMQTGSSKKKLGRFTPVFTAAMELEIVQHAQEVDRKFYGLTKESLKEVAYLLAVRNNIPNPFQHGKAGKAWIQGFMKQHPELSFRTPEATSLARCSGFKRDMVKQFFDNLEGVSETYYFSRHPLDVYNMDETGVKTSSSRPPKVVSTKGKRQVGVVSTSEKGELTTIIVCCNAAGNFLPPLFVFGKRKKVSPRMLDNGPAGSRAWCTDSGWIKTDIFHEWFEYFLQCVRPSPECPCLLILDNHSAHINLQSIELAHEKGVIMVSVPSHTTHKLQPLDVAVFKPFKDEFEKAVDTFQKQHIDCRINQYDIPELVKKAFERSATVNSATSRFRRTGIWPINKHIFTDNEFSLSSVHFVPEDSSVPSTSLAPIPISNPCNTSNYTESRPIFPSVNKINSPTPITPSKYNMDISPKSKMRNETNKPLNASEFVMSPLPKLEKKTGIKWHRNIQRSEITSSPFKKCLLEKQQKSGTKQHLSKEFEPTPSGSEQKGKHSTVAINAQSKIRLPQLPVDNPTPDNHVACFICDELFSQSKGREMWIQCNFCQKWAHEQCMDYSPSQTVYICDLCRSSV